jgi:hypothetical protein
VIHIVVVKVVNERFYNNCKVGFLAHPLGYIRFGLGIISTQQRSVKQQRRAKM